MYTVYIVDLIDLGIIDNIILYNNMVVVVVVSGLVEYKSHCNSPNVSKKQRYST